MEGRFARSLRLTKESWAVLRSNPQLAIFPIVSGIVSLIVAASFIVPAVVLMANTPNFKFDENNVPPLYYVGMFCFYTVSYFVVIFFNAAMVTCAHETLNGRPATFQDGISNAMKHLSAIIGWTLIAATVGMVLRMISERSGLIGRIIIGILGFAWTMLTYFVVPLLAVEGKGPVTSLKESGNMLRKTWGEQLIGNASINIITGLLSLVGLVPIVIGIVITATTGAYPAAVVGVGMAVVYWLILATVSASLVGIYQTALYMYATNGEVPAAFTAEYVQSAFITKEKKPFWNR
jgi:hypothetical protein